MVKQLDLGLKRTFKPDRNFDKGGRSFYFFDLDDNVFFLSTPTFIFHKKTNEEIALSSGEFAKQYSNIGKSGPYKDYFIDFNDKTGSFRRFRDDQKPLLMRPFCEDLKKALEKSDLEWKGPSWSCFYHAAFNQRPISLITARGHDPLTIKEGIKLFVRNGFLPQEPNYLSVYPVSNPKIQEELSANKDELLKATSELKFQAVLQSVEKAMETYGENPHHRFGMSDDDPKNLEMIFEAMLTLKRKYKENSFFVIRAEESEIIKEEVFLDHTEKNVISKTQQLAFSLRK